MTGAVFLVWALAAMLIGVTFVFLAYCVGARAEGQWLRAVIALQQQEVDKAKHERDELQRTHAKLLACATPTAGEARSMN